MNKIASRAHAIMAAFKKKKKKRAKRNQKKQNLTKRIVVKQKKVRHAAQQAAPKAAPWAAPQAPPQDPQQAAPNAGDDELKNLSDEQLLKVFSEPKGKRSNVPAIKFGLENEDRARQKYCEQHPSLEVVQVGLAIKDKFGFFGGSADGLIRTKSSPPDSDFYGLLEIKCIYSCREELGNGGKIEGCKFLDKHGNLKTTHMYYTQIQLCAWVTGAKFAHLYLWTENDHKLIPVPLDANFA